LTLKAPAISKKTLAGYKKQGIYALILGLRNNRDELLGSAVNISSMFVKDKMLIITVNSRVKEMKKRIFYNRRPENF
jgi:C-terminal processing protease CtpA/Prc